MAIASLVVGIVALVFALIPGMFWLSLILGIVGIVLGVFGRKDPVRHGMGTAGLVMSIVAVALGLLVFAACASCVGAPLACAGGTANALSNTSWY